MPISQAVNLSRRIGRSPSVRFHRLVLVQIFTGNNVLRNVVRSHFGNARIFGVLHTEDNACLERIPLLKQFFDALRIRCSITR